MNFEIRAFTKEDWLEVISELAVAVTDAFETAGITISFPERDLHLRNIPELREALQEVGETSRDDAPAETLPQRGPRLGPDRDKR